MKLPLAATLLAGGAIGLLLPGAERIQAEATQASLAPAAPSPPPSAQSLSGTASGGWADDVVLPRAADGHFYADVMVDGREYRMLVDTGATVVALSARDAEDMGLSWSAADVAPVARGASGPVEGVLTAIDTMSVGGHEARGVPAIIITEGAGVSLLGQSFLGTLGRVEITGDAMVLGARDD